MDTRTERGAGWLAPAGTILSILACYGTLAAMGALSLMGITLAIDVGLWAGAIVAFALIAFAGILLGWRIHRKLSPVLLGAVGTGMILWTMTGTYSRPIELAGFLCLAAAAWLDWRARHRRGIGPADP